MVDVDISMLHASCSEVELDIADSKGDKDVMIVSRIKSQSIDRGAGCRFVGSAEIQRVAGEIMIVHKGTPDLFNLVEFLAFNSSHVIGHLHFGPMIPNMVNPLIDVHKAILTNGMRHMR